jgi:hypothetical protein
MWLLFKLHRADRVGVSLKLYAEIAWRSHAPSDGSRRVWR